MSDKLRAEVADNMEFILESFDKDKGEFAMLFAVTMAMLGHMMVIVDRLDRIARAYEPEIKIVVDADKYTKVDLPV